MFRKKATFNEYLEKQVTELIKQSDKLHTRENKLESSDKTGKEVQAKIDKIEAKASHASEAASAISTYLDKKQLNSTNLDELRQALLVTSVNAQKLAEGTLKGKLKWYSTTAKKIGKVLERVETQLKLVKAHEETLSASASSTPARSSSSEKKG